MKAAPPITNGKTPEKTITKRQASLSDQSIFLVLGQFVQQGAVMAQGMILARWLSEYDFGTFRQMLLVISLTYTFAYLCLPESVSYFLAKLDKQDHRRFIFQTALILLLMGGLCYVFLTACSSTLTGALNTPEVSSLITIAAVIPVSQMMIVFLTLALVTEGRALLSSVWSVMAALVGIVTICLPIGLGYPLQTAVKCHVAGHVIVGLMSLACIWVTLGFTVSFRRDLFIQQLKFSIPYWVGYCILFMFAQSHKIIIATHFSAEKYSLFTVGATEIPVISRLATYVSIVLIPPCVKLAKNGQTDAIIALWRKMAAKMGIIIIPLFLILASSPQETLALLFGPKYIDAWPIFLIILLLLPLRLCNIQAIFKITGKTQYAIATASAAMIVGVGASIALLPSCGLMGPAIGYVLGRVVQLLVAIRLVRHDLPLTLCDAFAASTNLRILGAGLLAVGTSKLLLLPLDHLPVYLPLMGLLALLLFYRIGIWLGAISDDDQKLVHRWITLKPLLSRS